MRAPRVGVTAIATEKMRLFSTKETKAEREARKLEQERAARAKERERSVKEEHVDGGFLVTMGVYTGTEDFSKSTVRQLQVCYALCDFLAYEGITDMCPRSNAK